MTKAKLPQRMLTDTELEVMDVVWKLGEGTVKEVQEALLPAKKLAYTSVATMLKILEDKKVLASRKEDRVYTYYPLVKRTDYESIALQHVAKRLFQGRPSSMVMRLLDDLHLSEEELARIRKLLDERAP